MKNILYPLLAFIIISSSFKQTEKPQFEGSYLTPFTRPLNTLLKLDSVKWDCLYENQKVFRPANQSSFDKIDSCFCNNASLKKLDKSNFTYKEAFKNKEIKYVFHFDSIIAIDTLFNENELGEISEYELKYFFVEEKK